MAASAAAPGGGGAMLRLLVAVLAATLAATAAAAAAHGPAPVAVFEVPSPDALERGKSSLERWTAQAAASERGLINALLGNTCFTTAIAALNQQCSQLNNEQRCWLALQFTTCFQRASGFKVLDCPAVCPRRRSLQSCVEECTSKMDDKAQITYTQFFGDVFNMCLFLQTQNFHQVTAALVQDMHLSTAAANSSLAAIQKAVQTGLEEVRAVGKASAQLQGSMNASLELTGVLGSRQQQLLQGISTLEQAHAAHAARAADALGRLAEDAAALEARQARYEALQARLLNASESLLGHSEDMSGLLHLLMQYQAAGHSLLSTLHSTSTSLRDVVFYAAALAVPLVFWTHPPDARLLLLAGVLGTWACERAALQHYVFLRRLLFASSSSSGGNGVQDIKLAVRVLVLGGTLAATLWLLARRRAAQHRREAVFQAIQHALEEAHLRRQAAAQLGEAPSAAGLGGTADPRQPLRALLEAQALLQAHPAATLLPGRKAGSRPGAAATAAAAAAAVLATTTHAVPGHHSPLLLPHQQPGALLPWSAPSQQADQPPPALQADQPTPALQRAAVGHAPAAAAAAPEDLHAGQSGAEDMDNGSDVDMAPQEQHTVRRQAAAAAAAPSGPSKGGRAARTAATPPQTPAAARRGSGSGRAVARASGRKRPAAAAAAAEDDGKGAEPRPPGRQSKRQR